MFIYTFRKKQLNNTTIKKTVCFIILMNFKNNQFMTKNIPKIYFSVITGHTEAKQGVLIKEILTN